MDQQSLLKNVPLFRDLSDDSLDILVTHSRPITFRKNTILMSEGETGESMYVINNGSVKIFVSDASGSEMVLFIEGAGSYLGEISLLDGSPRTASAVTLEKTEVLAIAKTGFLECVHQNPEIAFAIIRSMTHRLRRATDAIRSLALNSVYQRLRAKLHDLAEDEEGFPTLPRRFSHRELGDMIGASREMVSKIMADLVRGEYIVLHEKRLRLLRNLPNDW